MKNRINKELKEKLKKESILVRESSMEVLKEFEALDKLANDLAEESKGKYWAENKNRFIKTFLK
jgi:hypothetical protein